MASPNLNKKEPESERELVFTRTYNAPRELVWKAWTTPELMAKWWGPDGFTITTSSISVKPGGVWRFVMHGPDGQDYDNKVTYDEIVKPERLVFHHGGDDAGLEPVLHHTTVTFEMLGDHQTRVTMRLLFPSAENRDWVITRYKADEGGRQHLARLDDYLRTGSTHQFTIFRVFDAPRDLVWKAWTTPELMAKWWGPKGASVGHSKMDLRPGGTYHYSMTFNGNEMWGKFTYREVAPPEKLVFVNCFSDAKGGIARHPFNPAWPLEMLSTISFSEPAKGKTKVAIYWTPLNASEEERKTFADGMGSMQQGWTGTLDQFAEFLEGQQ